MRYFKIKIMGILLFGLFFQLTSQAQGQVGNNVQSAAEQQRIREIRLLEWYALEQAQQQQSLEQQVQNVSLNQPYQQAPVVVAAPEREDLFNAANSGNIQQISELLSQGLDINVSNNLRETALHMAAARGHFEAVRFLVKNGAYVNAPTVKNWIALHHAVRFSHPNIVSLLINRGSSASARTSDGLSSIDMANNNRDKRILSILRSR